MFCRDTIISKDITALYYHILTPYYNFSGLGKLFEYNENNIVCTKPCKKLILLFFALRDSKIYTVIKFLSSTVQYKYWTTYVVEDFRVTVDNE